MSLPLLLSAAALGVLAAPHCLAMCGAPCAAVTGGRGGRTLAFLGGRVAGYALGGALAAASIAALGAWSRHSPALRPLWIFLQLALFMLGAWWLATGRQPAGLRTAAVVTSPVHWTRVPAPARPPLAGLAWVAWPCGVLQGALALAALAGTPVEGAGVMAVFALVSSPALGLAPWALRRLSARFAPLRRLAARRPGACAWRAAC